MPPIIVALPSLWATTATVPSSPASTQPCALRLINHRRIPTSSATLPTPPYTAAYRSTWETPSLSSPTHSPAAIIRHDLCLRLRLILPILNRCERVQVPDAGLIKRLANWAAVNITLPKCRIHPHIKVPSPRSLMPPSRWFRHPELRATADHTHLLLPSSALESRHEALYLLHRIRIRL